MKPIWESKLIQIEITNACINQCSNCTRFVGHHRKPFFMTLKQVRQAIDSLYGYTGNIGLMGGEPTVHPQFKEICKIFQETIPDKQKRELWTSGYKWTEYREIIKETFNDDLIAFNDHSSPDGKHQPLLTAIKDLIDNPKVQKRLIDDCWVQRRWSASITPKGGFFCEIAAALDHALDGPGGYPIKRWWWYKDPDQFQDQVKRYCYSCGATVPIGETSDHATCDLISESNLQKLQELKSPKILSGNYALYIKKWTEEEIKSKQKNWKPYNYRTFYAHTPEDYKRSNVASVRQVKT